MAMTLILTNYIEQDSRPLSQQPLVISQHVNRLECTWDMTQPDVLEKILSVTDGIQLNKRVWEENETLCHPRYFITESDITDRPMLKYYWDVKTLGLSLLQCRLYAMDERLLLMAIAYQRINYFEWHGQLPKLSAYIEQFQGQKLGDDLGQTLRDIGFNRNYSMQRGGWFLNSIPAEKNSEFACMRAKIMDRYDTKMPDNPMELARYESDLDSLDDFFRAHPMFLENLLVNLFCQETQPFLLPDKDTWTNFMFFAVRYAGLRLWLTGACALSSDWDDILKATSLFLKETTFPRAEDLLSKKGNWARAVVNALYDQDAESLAYAAMTIMT